MGRTQDVSKINWQINLYLGQEPARFVPDRKYAGILCREVDKVNNDYKRKVIAISTGFCRDLENIVAIKTNNRPKVFVDSS